MVKRTIKTCSTDGCKKPAQARGWCYAHYSRWRRAGDPEKLLRYSTPEEAFSEQTEWQGSCLVWTGPRNKGGYGVLSVNGTSGLVHRYTWEKANGPIPDGTFIDHEYHCNPACCNVKHLRLATPAENNYNKSGPRKNNRSSGVRNVYRTRDKWRVQVGKNGKVHWFGSYSTIEEAAEAAKKARQEMFGDFAGRG